MKGLTDVLDGLQGRYVYPVTNRLSDANSAVATDLAALIESATSLPVDLVCAVEDRLPFWLFVSKKRQEKMVRNAFEIGRDVGRFDGTPPPETRRSRHLHAV